MADNGGMDISQHRSAYQGFLWWAKWGTLTAIVITAIVMAIIA